MGGGVRAGRPAGWLPRGVSPGRRRSDGCALQRGAVGEPQRARLEHRGRRRRSAHWRAAQGDGADGLAPRPHRLQHLRGLFRRRGRRGRHRLCPGPCAPGHGARDRPHARTRPQLHRLDVRPRLGDGLPCPAHPHVQRPSRHFRGVRRWPRGIRCLGHPLGLWHLARRRRGRLAARHRRRRAAQGLPFPLGQRRPPRIGK